jgi:WD40 repeat protein
MSNNLLYVTAWQRIKPESCAYNAGCIIVYGTDGNVQRYIDTDVQSYLNLSVPEGRRTSEESVLIFFSSSIGIVSDSSNQLILADRYTSKILALNDGNQQQVIHFRGDRMKAPHYVCFSNDQNTMIVTDVGNNTVQFYEKNK